MRDQAARCRWEAFWLGLRIADSLASLNVFKRLTYVFLFYFLSFRILSFRSCHLALFQLKYLSPGQTSGLLDFFAPELLTDRRASLPIAHTRLLQDQANNIKIFRACRSLPCLADFPLGYDIKQGKNWPS